MSLLQAFFQLKSYDTVLAQLRAKIRQVDQLVSHISTWSQGVALLSTTLDAFYSKVCVPAHRGL